MVEADNPIQEDERLFRSISDDDVDPLSGAILESAVDLEGTSVDREKYLPDLTKIPLRAKGASCHAVTTPRRLPKVVHPSGASAENPPHSYEVFVLHDPKEGNDAHSEIRVGRHKELDYPGNRKPRSAMMKEALRSEIAAAMILHMKHA